MRAAALGVSTQTMYDLTKLKRESDSNDWYFQAKDGSELFVAGNEQEPDQESIKMAYLVIEQYEHIKSKAIKLLESFMKENGTWYIGTIHLGTSAKYNNCDFQLELGFEHDLNPHEYNYTGFVVCFILGHENPPPLNKPHPFKFIVEFS